MTSSKIRRAVTTLTNVVMPSMSGQCANLLAHTEVTAQAHYKMSLVNEQVQYNNNNLFHTQCDI